MSGPVDLSTPRAGRDAYRGAVDHPVKDAAGSGSRAFRKPRLVSRAELTLILGSWTVFGVLMAGQRLAYFAQTEQPLPISDVLPVAFAGAAVWAVLTIIVFALSRRFPLDRRPRRGSVMVHALASPAVAALESVFGYIIGILSGSLAPTTPFMGHFWQGFPFNVVVYWLLAGVAHGFTFYRRYRQRDAEAGRLAARLARAELDLLKSQLQPHFLFNTLTAISALMHRDVKAADRMLTRLSELLRAALEHNAEQEVSLQEELEFLEAYIEIERTRFGDRLTVDLDVQPNVKDARVPHMILQPLVENAVRYGVAKRAGAGRVTIRARGRRGMLDIEVLDDGPGVPAGTSLMDGVGLANTRARLEQLYGDSFTFEPGNVPDGGFRVSIAFPFRPVAERTSEQREEHP